MIIRTRIARLIITKMIVIMIRQRQTKYRDRDTKRERWKDKQTEKHN